MIRDRAGFACQTVSTDLLADHFPDSWGLLPRRIDSVVSLVDLFWTVLAAVRTPTAELPDIPPLGRGQNLLPIVRDPSLADADRAILCEANYPTLPLRQRPVRGCTGPTRSLFSSEVTKGLNL